jgi:hypothetical protein
MTHFSAVLIVPAHLLTEANALGAALGHGPTSYTVPIGDPVTHYGSRSRVVLSFIAVLAAVGHVPQSEWERLGLTQAHVEAAGPVVAGLDLEAHGLTEADRDAVIAGLVSDFRDEASVVPSQHFSEIAATVAPGE